MFGVCTTFLDLGRLSIDTNNWTQPTLIVFLLGGIARDSQCSYESFIRAVWDLGAVGKCGIGDSDSIESS